MARFEPVRNRSKLALEAITTLHPILTKTNQLEGYFEAEVAADGHLDLSVPPKAFLQLYVEHLKSNYEYIDRVVQNRLDIRRFPLIKAELAEMRKQDGDGPGHYHTAGTVSFQGVTQRVEGDLIINRLDEFTLEILGELSVNVRNYGVEPPRLISISVDPVVKVRLTLVVKRIN